MLGPIVHPAPTAFEVASTRALPPPVAQGAGAARATAVVTAGAVPPPAATVQAKPTWQRGERPPPAPAETERPEAPDQAARPPAPGELTEEERDEVRDLEKRDREVRAHEQAHSVAAGRHAGSPRYQYQRGPDGRLYAVEGEVPIDVSPVPNNPEATVQKMEQVRRAALAPASPSPRDRQVAALAAKRAAEARREIAERAFETLLEGRVPGPEFDVPRPPAGPVGEVAQTLSTQEWLRLQSQDRPPTAPTPDAPPAVAERMRLNLRIERDGPSRSTL